MDVYSSIIQLTRKEMMNSLWDGDGLLTQIFPALMAMGLSKSLDIGSTRANQFSLPIILMILVVIQVTWKSSH